MWHNPASKPGGTLYERFFAAWGGAPNKKLRLVFHGTPEANIESICARGLDPTRRAGQAHGPGEYFGGDASVSLGYCRGGRKMIVFVVSTTHERTAYGLHAHEEPHRRDRLRGAARPGGRTCTPPVHAAVCILL